MSFASVDEVAVRLRRSLSAEEQALVTQLLESATGMIAQAAGKDDEWAETYDPPAVINGMCIEVVQRVMSNPSGAVSESEALGAYSRTVRYDSGGLGSSIAGMGLMLTKAEELLASRVINGRTSATATVGSILDELPEWIDPAQLVGAFPRDSSLDDSQFDEAL